MLANWSPKLRGLFPGTVTEGVSPEPGMLYVEFDDGDSGYMRLEGIRMLPPDYPTVGELKGWGDEGCGFESRSGCFYILIYA